MSVINRIPQNNDISFHWEVELDCTDIQAIQTPIVYDIQSIAPYLSVENNYPIYIAGEDDMNPPYNDTSTYNINKNASSRMIDGSSYAYIAYPFKNWNIFVENFPFFRTRTMSAVYKFANTPQFTESGYEYTYRIYIGFYGHVVETDEIKLLGWGSPKYRIYSWVSIDSGYLTTTRDEPEIMFRYVGTHNMHIWYEPSEIDKAWIVIGFPTPYNSDSHFNIPSDWRYVADIQRLYFDCTNYDPLVYQKQEPYKN